MRIQIDGGNGAGAIAKSECVLFLDRIKVLKSMTLTTTTSPEPSKASSGKEQRPARHQFLRTQIQTAPPSTPNPTTAPHLTKRTATVDQRESEAPPLETTARKKSEIERQSERKSEQRQPGGEKVEPSDEEETVSKPQTPEAAKVSRR